MYKLFLLIGKLEKLSWVPWKVVRLIRTRSSQQTILISRYGDNYLTYILLRITSVYVAGLLIRNNPGIFNNLFYPYPGDYNLSFQTRSLT